MFYNLIEKPVEHLLPWHVYLSEYWEPQDIYQHYEEEVGVKEEEEEDISCI